MSANEQMKNEMQEKVTACAQMVEQLEAVAAVNAKPVAVGSACNNAIQGEKAKWYSLTPQQQNYATYGGLVVAGALVGAAAMYLYQNRQATSAEE